MPKYNVIISETMHGLRVDKALVLICENSSRSQIQKAIKKQNLLVNDVIISDLSYIVKENDKLNFLIEEEPLEGIVPANIPLDVVYEDEDLMVLNKSANMTVHPGAGDYKDTLVNALLHYSNELSDLGGEMRPGIVHRLDKNTSGLMVVAKNNSVHRDLAAQIESRTLKRKYKALVWGVMKPQEGVIKINMARSKLDRKKMTTVKSSGKTAITHYKTLEVFQKGQFSLVECSLETGRTHQIRVHLSHVGNSIVGDQTYGNNKRKALSCAEELKSELMKFNHQALHSFYISFVHPTSKLLMEFEKDLPIDYNQLILMLRKI